jgi:hypothetical protein
MFLKTKELMHKTKATIRGRLFLGIERFNEIIFVN